MYVMGYNTRNREVIDHKFDTFYILCLLGMAVGIFELTTNYGFGSSQTNLGGIVCGLVILLMICAKVYQHYLKRKNPSLEELVVKYKNDPYVLVNHIFNEACNSTKSNFREIAEMDLVAHSTNEQYDDYLRFLHASKTALRSATTANFESVVKAIREEAYDLAHEMTTNAYIVQLSQGRS